MRPACALLVFLLASLPLALADDALPVSLEIEAERRVGKQQIAELRREFQLAFARVECPVQLVSLVEGEPLEPELVLAIHLERWRERNVPGGRPIFNPKTGRERPGFKREVEVRMTVRVREAGAVEPLYEKDRRVRSSRGTTASLAYDPVVQARRHASSWVVRESMRPLCKEAKKRLKGRN